MHKGLITEKYYKLHANCIAVKGASRSLICDIQRGTYSFITNDLYKILSEMSTNTIQQIFDFYGKENHQTLSEYFDFLLLKDYIFYCDFDELDLFPALDLRWDSPSVITNSIIDVSKQSEHNYFDIFCQLEELGCLSIQLRFFSKISLHEITEILYNLKSSSISSVEIFLPFCDDVTNEDITQFVLTNLRVCSLVFHSSPKYRLWDEISLANTIILFYEDAIVDETHCGVISKGYFSINIETFTEAQTNNSCLNRKISIDQHGNIKNCPSITTDFGNIKTVKLKDVLCIDAFKVVWSIHKDQIEVCKDCEFRYICTDCRAYTVEAGLYSKPAKCDYNPYKETWDSGSTVIH